MKIAKIIFDAIALGVSLLLGYWAFKIASDNLAGGIGFAVSMVIFTNWLNFRNRLWE